MHQNLPTHGPWCGSRTFPLICRYCGMSIFFFSCEEHGSRVLFEELGSPWPVHACVAYAREQGEKGTRPNFLGRLNNGYAGSVSKNNSLMRATVRVAPESGVSRAVLGVVDHVDTFSTLDKLRLASGTLVASQLAKTFGGEHVLQITIRTDDRDVDPDAHDYKSYTLWVSVQNAPSVQRDDIVSATLHSDIILHQAGVPWICQDLQVLA